MFSLTRLRVFSILEYFIVCPCIFNWVTEYWRSYCEFTSAASYLPLLKRAPCGASRRWTSFIVVVHKLGNLKAYFSSQTFSSSDLNIYFQWLHELSHNISNNCRPRTVPLHILSKLAHTFVESKVDILEDLQTFESSFEKNIFACSSRIMSF